MDIVKSLLISIVVFDVCMMLSVETSESPRGIFCSKSDIWKMSGREIIVRTITREYRNPKSVPQKYGTPNYNFHHKQSISRSNRMKLVLHDIIVTLHYMRSPTLYIL